MSTSPHEIGDDERIVFGADNDFTIHYDSTKDRAVIEELSGGFYTELLTLHRSSPQIHLEGKIGDQLGEEFIDGANKQVTADSIIGGTSSSVSDASEDNFYPFPDALGALVMIVVCDGAAGIVHADIDNGTATKIADANGNIEALDEGGTASDTNLGVEARSDGVGIVAQNELGSEQDITFIPLG